MTAKAKIMKLALHLICDIFMVLVAVVASSPARLIEEIVMALRAGCIGMICVLKSDRKQGL